MSLELNEDNFQAEVNDYVGSVVVDFWAPWCGPCRMMTPIIDSLATKFDGKVKIAKVNIDGNQNLAVKFNVSTIPTIVFFKNGQIIHTSVGVSTEIELEKLINEQML